VPTPKKKASKARNHVVHVSTKQMQLAKAAAERLAKAEAMMQELKEKLKIAEQKAKKRPSVPIAIAPLPASNSRSTTAPAPKESLVDMATSLFQQTAALSQLVAEAEKQTLVKQREIAAYNQQTAMVLDARARDNKRKESLLDAENGFLVAEYEAKTTTLLKKRNFMSFDEDPNF
jgi:hypothetical protein